MVPGSVDLSELLQAIGGAVASGIGSVRERSLQALDLRLQGEAKAGFCPSASQQMAVPLLSLVEGPPCRCWGTACYKLPAWSSPCEAGRVEKDPGLHDLTRTHVTDWRARPVIGEH